MLERGSARPGTESVPAVESLLIEGEWSATGAQTTVSNPGTGEPYATVARAGEPETRAALDAAATAFATWRRTSALDRAAILDRTAALLREHAEEIGRTLAIETGKLLFEAVAEVRFSADYFAFYAGETTRLERLTAVEGRPSGPQLLVRKPAGVAASLTPWNFPVSIQARKVAPALAAGCTVVARPSDEAPLSVVELFRCIEEAGAPPGAVNLLTGPAAEVTGPIVSDARVRVLSFTGSTGVGKDLYAASAPTMKRLALELGGCAPFIVCADADLDRAVDQAMLAKLRNNGQSCVAANTFYVEEPVREEFVEAFGARVAAVRTGDQLDDASQLGPMINARRRDAMAGLSEQALAAGFERVVAGPAPADGLRPGAFFAPELLAARSYRDVDPAFLEVELFGPIAPVVGFDAIGPLLERLAANPLGLAGYVFSRDVGKATRIATALDVGIAGVNEGLAGAVNMPMGGVKDSGLGREGGRVGMEEFLDLEYIALRESPVAAWGAAT